MGLMFCSILTCHKSQVTPYRVPSHLYFHYFHTREKREEKPHLLAGFSLSKGFLEKIFVLFCG
jgi:hypothetical protein